MTIARTILDRPAQFQWDLGSSDKSDNCNPTVEAMIAGFYHDRHVDIDAMRMAMTGSIWGEGTTQEQAVRGLSRFGIPAKVRWLFPSQVRSLLSQNIPVSAVVDYGKFPHDKRYITDFSFDGPHQVLFCANTTAGGVRGIWARDPDHGSPARPERPDKTFWPEAVWVKAFKADILGRGLAVVPDKAKVIPPPPRQYRVYIDHGAVVRVAILDSIGRIADWTDEPWNGADSSAPCGAPHVRKVAGGGTATVVRVSDGLFVGKYVHIGTGVTAK